MGPDNRDYSNWGSLLGSPYFWKLPCVFTYIHVFIVLEGGHDH